MQLAHAMTENAKDTHEARLAHKDKRQQDKLPSQKWATKIGIP